MKISRWNVLGAAAGALGASVLRYPAGAAEYDLKFATEFPPDFHMTRALFDAVEAIKRDTNGRVDVKMFTNSSLGGQTQMLQQLRVGAIDMTTGADFVLSGVVPIAGINQLPFIYNGEKEAMSAMNGPLGKYRLAAIAQIGIFPFERSWNSGFRQVMNQIRPVVTPDDIKGLKIRTPESQVVTSTFKALGSSPTPLTASEMYVSLQTHLVDGLEIPLTGVAPYKLYEVLKYASYTNHIWTSYTMLASGQLWQRLPKGLRDVVDRRINEAADHNNAGMDGLEAGVEQSLKSSGMLFNKADIPAFRAVLKRSGLYAQWKGDYGAQAWSLLEKSVGSLA